ncbi:hypothetical protein FHR84_001297 [Actinopolyspora biskrensis]|uniref:Uncharacterized protein n=1 Tax=Actinopolyspora biskrensis TaxID=1470178 RepID=A0A852YYC3_9ACTN|nr:hypothetical protein [Actinopolyspora biskrensis]NYH77975.1 hypothetical protein [Actinopolyspora biskrensis]
MDIPSRTGSTSRPHRLGRRELLRLSALAPLASALISCSAPADENPDLLVPLADDAGSDAELARATADKHPELAERAGAVAEVRTEHAKNLRREITRITDERTAAGEDRSAPEVTDDPGEAAEKLREALESARRRTAETVPRVSGYRAGLVGSISAACASLLEVVR